jgi:hypothetical protein
MIFRFHKDPQKLSAPCQKVMLLIASFSQFRTSSPVLNILTRTFRCAIALYFNGGVKVTETFIDLCTKKSTTTVCGSKYF